MTLLFTDRTKDDNPLDNSFELSEFAPFIVLSAEGRAFTVFLMIIEIPKGHFGPLKSVSNALFLILSWNTAISECD
jgi:hypothetical protein